MLQRGREKEISEGDDVGGECVVWVLMIDGGLVLLWWLMMNGFDVVIVNGDCWLLMKVYGYGVFCMVMEVWYMIMMIWMDGFERG
jgi:hypothetical protein